MAIECTQFEFVANTTTGTQTIVSGLSYTPKAYILYTVYNTSNATYQEGAGVCIGFSDGTTSRCIGTLSQDAVATSNAGRAAGAGVIRVPHLTTPDTALDAVADHSSFGSGTIIINWTDAPTNAIKVYGMCWGGDDLQAKVVSHTYEVIVTGNRAYTGVGFQPEVMFTLCPENDVALPFVTTHGTIGFGAAVSSTKRFLVSIDSEDAATAMDTWSLSTSSKCVGALRDATGAYSARAFGDFVSFGSDGPTINWEIAPSATGGHWFALYMAGGDWDILKVAKRTSTGTTIVTPSVNTIKGILGTTTCLADNDAANAAHARLSIGAASSTTLEGGVWTGDKDATASSNSEGAKRSEDSNFLVMATENATATSSTTEAIAEISAMGTDFTLNYTTCTTLVADLYFVCCGEITSTLFTRPITESAISVSDTNARLLMANRPISEASISVSDTNTRVLSAFRTISEASISVNETLARVRMVPRSISEPSISVSDALARQLIATRILSEASISVSDALTRVLFAFRTLSESSISVSDALVRRLSAFRTLSEASISVSDTLARQLIALRSISEASISVSDALARILLAVRAISEASISVSDSVTAVLESNPSRFISEDPINVSETLAKQLSATRAISESSISVSETLNRVLTSIRAISEPSISVSETLTRILSALRTISESSISVSDTLARLRTVNRSISEPSITVSDALVRWLSSFRIITEPAISVSETLDTILAGLNTRSINEPGITVSDLITTLKTFPPLATYIVDPGYTNPTRVRITFKSKIDDDSADPESGDQIIYYQYDAFHYDTRPFNILNFSLRLVEGEVSTATLDIEDSAQNIIDRSKISFNAVVEIDFKKENGRDWTRVLTGYVRRLGVMRPATNALMYRVTVLSKSIVYNERVTNFKRAAKRTAIDSTIPLSTDSKMQANRLFEELHTATDILPLKSPTIQKTGDFSLDTGSISDEVSDFISEIAPGLGVASDVANAIAEVTGAIWGTDEFGNPFLRYPTEKHSGIIIKDDPQNTDSAVNTSVNMDSFEFEDTIDAAEGFANRLYVLNSKDTKSTASSSKASSSTTLTTRWIAQSFIATDNNITGAAFILSKIGNPTNTTGSIKGVLRANIHNSTTGQDFPTGATLATFEISLGQLSNSADVIFVNDIKTANGVITPGDRYWWVLQGTGLFDDSHTVRWHHDNDLVTPNRPISARVPLVDIDPTKPGNQLQWILSPFGPVYAFSTFSSINHILTQSDYESIKNTGTLVEAIVNLPAFDDDATFQKVLVKILQSSAKIKRIFSYARVTIPTGKFFLPGELVTVIDSKAKLQSEKIINAEIAEVSYNLDTSTNALGIKYADLRLIGFIDPIVDNYLENKEC